ncbi:MAG: GNAT family N-acetyltransferase [Armatimonadetes bacterium]|nr:GNAT family N-acetyltransferase [Anaerolineae bacterium]
MLKSDKLILRAMTRADLPRLCAFNNTIEVELAGGGDPPIPQSLERLQAEFDRDAGNGGRDGAQFAIEVKGVFIGQCALFNFDATGHTCELGITIGDPAYWGQGYGKAAVTLLLNYAFQLRNFRKVWLRVHGNNTRAQRAYAACGFTEEGRLRAHIYSAGSYDDMVMMGILRAEWERTQLKA